MTIYVAVLFILISGSMCRDAQERMITHYEPCVTEGLTKCSEDVLSKCKKFKYSGISDAKRPSSVPGCPGLSKAPICFDVKGDLGGTKAYWFGDEKLAKNIDRNILSTKDWSTIIAEVVQINKAGKNEWTGMVKIFRKKKTGKYTAYGQKIKDASNDDWGGDKTKTMCFAPGTVYLLTKNEYLCKEIMENNVYTKDIVEITRKDECEKVAKMLGKTWRGTENTDSTRNCYYWADSVKRGQVFSFNKYKGNNKGWYAQQACKKELKA